MSPDDRQRLYSAIVDVAALASVVILGESRMIGEVTIATLLGALIGQRLGYARGKTAGQAAQEEPK